VKINGEMHYLWRAVDHEGEALESSVTKTRDTAAVIVFMKKALKRHGSPEKITSDRLASYKAAMKDLGKTDKQEVGRWANNRVENSPLQKFASAHANIQNQFHPERHIVDRRTFKRSRTAALAEWRLIAS
jgi:putative transposase